MQPDVPATLEEVATLADLSRFHARQRPDREAMLFEERSTSYAELDRQANQVANGLLERGVAPGARVGFMDKNSDEFYQVVLKEGESVAEDELVAFARERIAAYKLPKSVDFVAELPRNPSGKILKRELREPYWRGMQRNVN